MFILFLLLYGYKNSYNKHLYQSFTRKRNIPISKILIGIVFYIHFRYYNLLLYHAK
nr:MAG TPA: hypothetical protein [Crassvirales sp.]